MNKQREIIYGDRRKILEGESMKETVLDMIKKVISEAVPAYCESRHRDNWDLEGLVEHLRLDFPLPPYAEIPPDELGETPESVADRLYQYAAEAYDAKEKQQGTPEMRKLEQILMLRTIDGRWVNYLTMMEHFKEGIGLRAFGQKDPDADEPGRAGGHRRQPGRSPGRPPANAQRQPGGPGTGWRRKAGSQRSLLVRQRQEVQEVSRKIAMGMMKRHASQEI